MTENDLTDAELAHGLRDIAAALDGQAHLTVVGWWRGHAMLEAATARTLDVLDDAVRALELPGERKEREELEFERTLAEWGARRRPVRVRKVAP